MLPDIERHRQIVAAALFAAWLDPATLAQWTRPGEVTSAIVDVDALVGGTFRIVMTHGRGDSDHWGEYLAIEPPSLLSFAWISANTEHRPNQPPAPAIRLWRTTG